MIVFSGQATRNEKIRQLFDSTNNLHVSSPVLQSFLFNELDNRGYFTEDSRKMYIRFRRITDDSVNKTTSDFDLLGGMFNIASGASEIKCDISSSGKADILGKAAEIISKLTEPFLPLLGIKKWK